MPNALANILPKILARGLDVLRERAVMPRLVNSDFSADAAEKGDTIDVPVSVAVGVQDVTPSATPPTPGDTTPTKVPISLDQWRQSVPFHLTDKELVEIDRNRHFIPLQMMEAVKALANDTNEFLHNLARRTDRGVFNFVGTAGTTPFASDVTDATNSRKQLQKELAPRSLRRGVVDFEAEANMLALKEFSDAEKVGSAVVKLEGEIGRKFGIDWVADDAVQFHTAGTIVDASAGRTCAINNGAGYAIGIDTMDVNSGAEATAIGTIVNGDIISFAGHNQTYVVIDNASSAQFAGAPLGTYTFAANAIADLKIYPALRSAVVDDEVITVEASFRRNLTFHRDAFGFAMRPLLESTQGLPDGGSEMAVLTDPVTGLSLRIEVSRQHKQTAWELDLLYGGELVRPELCSITAG